jgi:hypothetical protein
VLQDVLEVDRPQSDAETEVRMAEAGGKHGGIL